MTATENAARTAQMTTKVWQTGVGHPTLYSITAIEILGTYLQEGWKLDRVAVNMYRLIKGDEVVQITREMIA